MERHTRPLSCELEHGETDLRDLEKIGQTCDDALQKYVVTFITNTSVFGDDEVHETATACAENFNVMKSGQKKAQALTVMFKI